MREIGEGFTLFWKASFPSMTGPYSILMKMISLHDITAYPSRAFYFLIMVVSWRTLTKVQVLKEIWALQVKEKLTMKFVPPVADRDVVASNWGDATLASSSNIVVLYVRKMIGKSTNEFAKWFVTKASSNNRGAAMLVTVRSASYPSQPT